MMNIKVFFFITGNKKRHRIESRWRLKAVI